WNDLSPRAADPSKHYKVIALDNRGTGRSSKPEGPYSMKTMADDVAGLLTYLKIEKAHVFGGSMGGYIAQEMAIRHPEKVDALILVCSTPGGKAWDLLGQREAFEKLSWMYSPPSGMTEQEIIDEFFRIVYQPKYTEENYGQMMSLSTEYPTVTATYEKQMDACVNHDTPDRLSSIDARTLVIHGEDDVLLFPEGARMLADNIPDASLIMLKEAGHGVSEEKWDEIYPKIRAFLG
ncbi:MAG: alpha/beta fold hydrolase, partial [Candidatus Bathyarchaeota archaeon]